MWPFNRNKNTNQANVPEEIQEYYRSEQRERSGIAWLLAVGTLIATVAIAVGLFFGGRWVINNLFGSDDTTPATTTEQEATSGTSTNEQPSSGDAANGTDETGGGDVAGSQDDNQAHDATDTHDSSTDGSATSTTPATGGSETTNLPSTGPSGDATLQ